MKVLNATSMPHIPGGGSGAAVWSGSSLGAQGTGVA